MVGWLLMALLSVLGFVFDLPHCVYGLFGPFGGFAFDCVELWVFY